MSLTHISHAPQICSSLPDFFGHCAAAAALLLEMRALLVLKPLLITPRQPWQYHEGDYHHPVRILRQLCRHPFLESTRCRVRARVRRALLLHLILRSYALQDTTDDASVMFRGSSSGASTAWHPRVVAVDSKGGFGAMSVQGFVDSGAGESVGWYVGVCVCLMAVLQRVMRPRPRYGEGGFR